jgi:hypothetical protein
LDKAGVYILENTSLPPRGGNISRCDLGEKKKGGKCKRKKEERGKKKGERGKKKGERGKKTRKGEVCKRVK